MAMIPEAEGVITSPFEPVKNRRKYWHRKEINIIPTNVSNWESGYYSNTDGTKQPYDVGGRVRLKDLIEVTPNAEYIVSTSSASALIIIRTYDQNQQFIRSVGGISNGNILTTSENEKYISITIDDNSTLNTQNILTKIENGTIKPFIGVEEAIFELVDGNYKEINKKVNIMTEIEFDTNFTRNGKVVYGKEINFGALPNNTTKQVEHGISDNFKLIKMQCSFENSQGVKISFDSDGINPSHGTTAVIFGYISKYHIVLVTNHNASDYAGTVTIFYTKN